MWFFVWVVALTGLRRYKIVQRRSRTCLPGTVPLSSMSNWIDSPMWSLRFNGTNRCQSIDDLDLSRAGGLKDFVEGPRCPSW